MDNVNLVHLVIVTMAHSKANTESTSTTFHRMNHRRNDRAREDAILYKYMAQCKSSTFSNCYMAQSKANTKSTSIRFHCMHHRRNGKKRQDAIVYKYMAKCEFSTFSDCYNGIFKSQY